MLLKEMSGHGLAAPPGLSGFSGGRARPSPVLKLFSFAIPKSDVPIEITIDEQSIAFDARAGTAFDPAAINRPTPPALPDHAASDLVTVPLIKLAWARSGDKGDKANVGVLPRHLDYAPWIWAALTEDEVTGRFAHFLDGDVQRFYLPGTGAINFLMDRILGGGGVASLRNDPQGKGYSQILLQTPIPIPQSLAEALPK